MTPVSYLLPICDFNGLPTTYLGLFRITYYLIGSPVDYLLPKNSYYYHHLSQILWGTIHEGISLKLLDLSFLVLTFLTFPYLSNLSEPL